MGCICDRRDHFQHMVYFNKIPEYALGTQRDRRIGRKFRIEYKLQSLDDKECHFTRAPGQAIDALPAENCRPLDSACSEYRQT